MPTAIVQDLGSDEGQRLEDTVAYLMRVGEVLASIDDFEPMVRKIVDVSVPTFFDGLRVTVNRWERVPEFVVERGVDAAAVHGVDLPGREGALGRLEVTCAARSFDAVDRAVLGDVAVRLGTALQTARRLAREQFVADTLQRALLPEHLPQNAGLAVSAAYLPGTDDAIVGGDWYDVFDLPDGRRAFSIGDVAGHGLRAAVVMGEVRQAFRAAAVSVAPPSVVLERANTIVNMRAEPVIVTALFGIVDTATSTVTYAVAGHPPPIFATRDGGADVLPAQGIPLGVAESVFTCDWTITLPPGATLVLYTDGLTEHSRDVAEGERELLDAVRAEVSRGGERPAQRIVDRVFAQRSNIDDVAALALEASEARRDAFAFEAFALPRAVPLIRHALADYLRTQEVDEDDTHAVLLAVGEAIANAVEHAYGSERGIVRVRATRRADELLLEVRDDGRWKRAEHREERGRGIKIMRALMDRVEIRTVATETSVTLAFRLGVQR